MPLITFLSDFGWQDHYVASVKAKILTENPEIQIIDISHKIKKFDIIHGAQVLKSVYQDFPEGTIHIAAVNMRTVANESMIAIKLNNQIILGSNNGMLGLLDEKSPDEIIKIKEEEPFSNFPAKDTLAVAALKLQNKKPIAQLGEAMSQEDFVRYLPQRVKATREIIQGHVVHVDDYGNLITNIGKKDFDILSKGKSVQVKFRNYVLSKVLSYYHETSGGEAFALFNDQSVLEIGIKEGNAAELLGMEYGSMVSIKFSDY
ncbi:SAM-dependent chlorinase/fluorinase [Marivirga sp. S37H4]|uniref:SAM-dependent chlorinase/fluorinase n=1 Tax=Marivirga aurantiaca TaxID=2802615 RepID=A0A935C763_9BACT|nr:SAM-dependent chlorinase/fluorinase [Marivirga aurantiaca]MBK6264745.1 SAM-dependent chlorinase/fluorinase [Marivirga aurantiaca]